MNNTYTYDIGFVMGEIHLELERAEFIHPVWPIDLYMQIAIIAEELGELTKSILDGKPDRQECVQVAAMAMRMLLHWQRTSEQAKAYYERVMDPKRTHPKTIVDDSPTPEPPCRTDLEIIRQFVQAVERRAEEKMLITHKLEGSHWTAMREILQEMTNDSDHHGTTTTDASHG